MILDNYSMIVLCTLELYTFAKARKANVLMTNLCLRDYNKNKFVSARVLYLRDCTPLWM